MTILPAARQRTPSSPVRFGARAIRLLAAVLAVAIPWSAAATAHAAPDEPRAPESVALRWDGPTTALDWRGGTYTLAAASFIGSPVAVPGDMTQRTATVRNDGPSAAKATVVISATTLNPDQAVNTELETLIHLFWNVNGHTGDELWSQARQNSYQITFSVNQGEEFPITVGYRFPWDATGGRTQGEISSVLSFDVQVMLEGDTDVVVIEPGKKGPSSHTGGNIIGFPFLLLAASLLAASLLALFLYLRRKNKDTPGDGSSGPPNPR